MAAAKPTGTKPKLSGPEQADAFMAGLEHPLKPAIEEARRIVANADSRLEEHIKWNAPSFHVRSEDRITFNLRGKDFFLLVFHCGAKVREAKGGGRIVEDDTGLLEWASDDRATVRLNGLDDANAKRDKLTRLVRMWLDATVPG